MVPAGQCVPVLPGYTSEAASHFLAAAQPIPWPHRTLRSDGRIGQVLPDFRPPLHGNPRGSLRTDLALYDIIFFIALGLSMEKASDLFRCHLGEELPRRTLQNWADRERICWPPANYTTDFKRAHFERFCARLPLPARRLARAQQQRVDLMQRWLEGQVTDQQAAEEERLIQQAVGRPAE
ncbi:hypothetical protein C2E21_6566 [Chlorella sorokiniana]|uniref:Uncharacterized protein n=1 Tax=Chlorella sorokiniana TaxID=3076 RepID=A0A2P6TJT4_CHLSO|nr:hypothetical protein C2E21_6566 [Chlorella sorokiniana]|eukprot:PRW44346.1 hypothetical protein C2E21_6566 [Chlorella sorokiniana]